MQTPTLTNPSLEIAETLFEARAEIRYTLAIPLASRLLSTGQHERLERLLSDREALQAALKALSSPVYSLIRSSKNG